MYVKYVFDLGWDEKLGMRDGIGCVWFGGVDFVDVGDFFFFFNVLIEVWVCDLVLNICFLLLELLVKLCFLYLLIVVYL